MTVRRVAVASVAAVMMTGATLALAQSGAPKKPLAKLTCEEFLAVEESFKPKVVYWAVAYGKGGKPEAAMIDVEGAGSSSPSSSRSARRRPKIPSTRR